MVIRDKLSRYNSRAFRTRKALKSSIKSGVLRLSVFKSNAHFYAQLIDDSKGYTLVSASSVVKKEDFPGKRQLNAEVAKQVAHVFAERCGDDYGKAKIVFDRGANRYIGLVKVFADTIRGCGFNF